MKNQNYIKRISRENHNSCFNRIFALLNAKAFSLLIKKEPLLLGKGSLSIGQYANKNYLVTVNRLFTSLPSSFNFTV